MPHYQALNEITVGCNGWKLGRGRQYDDLIKRKVRAVVRAINAQYVEFTGEEPPSIHG